MEVWIGRDGERHGPYQESDVRDWLRSGKISRQDLGWYEGLADWQPLSVLFPDALTIDNAYVAPGSTSTLPPSTITSLEDYAGFWKRLAAWIIDYMILLVPITAIAISMGVISAFEHLMTQLQSGVSATAAMTEYASIARLPALLGFIVGYVYYVFLECSRWQATPGKLALNLRVTDMNGHRLSVGRSLARNAIRLFNAVTGLIPFLFYIVTAWTPRKQGVHDLIAGTLVLNGRASEFQNAAKPEGGANGSLNA